MKILTVGMDPGNQGLKLRDKKNTNHSNLGMKKLQTAFLYTCGQHIIILICTYQCWYDRANRDNLMGQWKHAGPINRRSVDRNHTLLEFFSLFNYLYRAFLYCNICWSVGIVVITSALHAEGCQFNPGKDVSLLRYFWLPTCLIYQDGQMV